MTKPSVSIGDELIRDKNRNKGTLKRAAKLELEQVENAIKRHSNRNKGSSACTFILPKVIATIPLIDLSPCHKYVVKALRRSNIDVSQQGDVLTLSWKRLLVAGHGVDTRLGIGEALKENKNRNRGTLRRAAKLELALVLSHIKRHNKHSSTCTYTLPEVIETIPLIDLSPCHKYVIKALKRSNIDVLRQGGVLALSWKRLLEAG